MRQSSSAYATVVLSLSIGCSSVREGGGAWVMTASAEDDGGPGDDGIDLDESGGTVNATYADDDAGDDASTMGEGTTTAATSHGHTTADPDTGDDGGGGTGGVDCPDNCYCEPIDPAADLSDLEQAYAGDAVSTMLDVLARRWPAGHDLLTDKIGDPYLGSFTDPSSFASVMDGLMTEAHEGTHGWEYGNASVDEFAYFLRGDLQFFPPKLHGFDRSEIYGMVEGSSTDLYKDLYLVGDQGTYGFYELLDEMNCYINGMAAIGVVGEYIPYGVSGRDGAVAFMYYLELYLKLARTQHPDVYDQIKNDPDFNEMIKLQWLRLHFLLQEAGDLHDNIGLYDQDIRQLMYADENQSEIEMLIDHELEASNCLP